MAPRKVRATSPLWRWCQVAKVGRSLGAHGCRVVLPLREPSWTRAREKSVAEQNEIEARVARIREKATVTFDDREKAERWMRARNRVLEAVPIDLLDSDEGAETVETVLHRIEHGVFS